MNSNTPLISYRAFTNIALIKYWGKRNPQLFLPMTNSLSLTLDAFYTDTTVKFNLQSNEDIFILNNALQNNEETKKISRFINLFRNEANSDLKVHIESVNHVPTAAGLASSASAFAALGLGLNDLFELNMDTKLLSTFVRQGSGSASRSLYGGFVEWHKGTENDSISSYSEQIDSADWDIHMLVITINQHAKKISSRMGMQQTMDTSPFYRIWPEEVAKDLTNIKSAIQEHDFEKVGSIAEHNAMKMHATMLAANPSFTYFEPDTIVAIKMIQELRASGIPCYITMDAGPNVKVLCQKENIQQIKNKLGEYFETSQLTLASPGPNPIKLL